jgi:hypothetical protein
MMMLLDGSLYQISPALLAGIALGLRKGCTLGSAAALGAKLSFILGAASMLFSETRWWPVTWSMFGLVLFSRWLDRCGGRLRPYESAEGLLQKN